MPHCSWIHPSCSLSAPCSSTLPTHFAPPYPTATLPPPVATAGFGNKQGALQNGCRALLALLVTIWQPQNCVPLSELLCSNATASSLILHRIRGIAKKSAGGAIVPALGGQQALGRQQDDLDPSGRNCENCGMYD